MIDQKILSKLEECVKIDLDFDAQSKTITYLKNQKLLKAFLPETLGGLNFSLPEMMELIERTSFIDGSLGWLVQIGNGGNYFISNLSNEVVDDLFGSHDFVIAGSGAVNTKAIEKDNGVVVSGKWNYCSGSAYASHFTIGFKKEGDSTKYAAILPKYGVNVQKNWDAFGLRSTSTNTIEINNQFIPQRNIFVVDEQINYQDLAIVALPFDVYAQAFFMPVAFGVFSHFIVEAAKIIEEKQQVWLAFCPNRLTFTNSKIAAANELLSKCKTTFIEQMEKALASGKNISPELKKDINLTVVEGIKAMNIATNELFPQFGMNVLSISHPLNKCYLDLKTLSQHYLLNE